jgi:putative FmdB family regulatory protein
MPLYEYQCDACSHRFERIQKFSDPLVDTCPSCGGVVRKLLSSPAFQFKGTGWYITDYPKKKSSSEEGKSSEGKSSEGKPSAGGSSSSTDNKSSGTTSGGSSGTSGGPGSSGSASGGSGSGGSGSSSDS